MSIFKNKIAILATIFMFCLGFQKASAVTLEGFSIGAGYNYSAFMGSGKETMTGSGAATTQKDITEEDGAFTDTVPSIFVEFDAGPASIGIEYVAGDMTTPSNTNLQDTTTNTVKATFKDHTMLYANIDLPFSTYLKLGYQIVDIATQENLGTGSKYNDVDTDGYTIGLGYNRDMNNGMFLRAEVSAHSYDDVSATSTVDSSKKVDVTDMYGATAAIKVGKTF